MRDVLVPVSFIKFFALNYFFYGFHFRIDEVPDSETNFLKFR